MLYTYQTGSSASPAIVFLHGGGLSGRMWQPQWEQLGHDYYCLVPDLPEQGRSLHNGPFSLDSAAEQVLEIIRERVPARKVHLVGLSLGGAIALTMMRIAPEYIDHGLYRERRPAWGSYWAPSAAMEVCSTGS